MWIEPVVSYKCMTSAQPTRETYPNMAAPMFVIFNLFFQFGCGYGFYIVDICNNLSTTLIWEETRGWPSPLTVYTI